MHRLFFTGLILVASCGDDSAANGMAAQGNLGGACLPDGSCSGGLSCSPGGFCQQAAGSGGTGAAGNGDGDGGGDGDEEGSGYVGVSPDGCPPRAPCGDGVVDTMDGEVCDPGNAATGAAMNLGGESCSSLGLGGDGLRCNCRCQYDLDGCTEGRMGGSGQ